MYYQYTCSVHFVKAFFIKFNSLHLIGIGTGSRVMINICLPNLELENVH